MYYLHVVPKFNELAIPSNPINMYISNTIYSVEVFFNCSLNQKGHKHNAYIQYHGANLNVSILRFAVSYANIDSQKANILFMLLEPASECWALLLIR